MTVLLTSKQKESKVSKQVSKQVSKVSKQVSKVSKNVSKVSKRNQQVSRYYKQSPYSKTWPLPPFNLDNSSYISITNFRCRGFPLGAMTGDLMCAVPFKADKPLLPIDTGVCEQKQPVLIDSDI